MAMITCSQSQAVARCYRPQAGALSREALSCSQSSLSLLTANLYSSSCATPSHALSSLRLSQGLPCGTNLSSSLSGISSHADSSSFVQKTQLRLRRHFASLAPSEKKLWKSSGGSKHPKRYLRLIAKANDSTADEPLPSEMSLENALKLLGVGEGASFEEILRAKKVMVDRSGGDQEQLTQVEAAYDMLLMQSLSQRRAGKVVDSGIKYADVRKAKSASSGVGPAWLQKVLKTAPVSIGTPSSSELGVQTGIFGALVVWAFATGVMSTPGEASFTGQEIPGTILAIGFGLSIYFLRKQNIKLGKASLITISGLVAGALVGGLVESWLRVDIVPVLGIGSPAIVVSEFVLFSLWFSSLYLR